MSRGFEFFVDVIDFFVRRLEFYGDRLYKELPEKRDGNRLTEAENELQAVEKSLGEIDLDSAYKKASEDIYNSLKSERGGKGSMLLESYNEVDRRGKKFEVDTSKMDSKRAEVYKRYTDSGILNNTNRTHDFVDMLVALEADRGIKIDVSNNKRLAESGFSVEGATVNGVKTADRLVLNVQSAKALNKVLGHEVTHVLEGSEAYSELEKLILEYGKGEIEARTAELKKLYKTDDVQSELVADMVGDYLFSDERFIKSLAQNKNLFQRIYDEIKYLLKIAGKGTKQEKEFARLKRAFEKALSESKAETKAEKTKNTTDKGDVSFSKIKHIEQGMSDGERYNILKNKIIENVPKVNISKMKDIKSKLSTAIKETYNLKETERKKLFNKLGEEFNVFSNYNNADIELSFRFTKGGVRESTQKQRANYESFAKMFSCFDNVIESAVGIEIHNKNSIGYKPDATLKNMYVLVSAFEDGNNIVPVKLEIKEFTDKPNSLYVAVALENIKKEEVIKQGNTKNGVTQYSRSSIISVAELFRNVNPKDKDFIKYIPNGFLDAEKLEVKRKALEEDNKKSKSQFFLSENIGNVKHRQFENDDLAPLREDLNTDDVKYSLTKAQLEEEQQRLLDEQRLLDIQLESGDISDSEYIERMQEMSDEYDRLGAQIANVVEATENARKYTKKDAEAF